MSKSPLEDPRSLLVFRFPFFGTLALYLIEKPTNSIPTGGTDGRHLFYNPEWLKTLSSDEALSFVAHEVMHPALGHVYRWRRGSREHQPWNIAGDHVINLMLKESGLTIPKDWCCDDQYKDMSTEEIYNKLPKPDPNCKTCGGTGMVPDDEPNDSSRGQGQDGEDDGQDGNHQNSSGGGQSQDDKDGGQDDGPKKFKACPDCGNGGCPGGLGFDIIEGDASETSEEERKRANEWTRRLLTAAQAAKQRGSLPAGIERMLDELLRPKFPWYIILSHLIAEVVRDDYDILRPDRRLLQQGIYLPDIYNEKVHVAVGVDTSGSISQEEMTQFLSETWGILHSRNVNRIRLMACDAEVHYDKTFQPHEAAPKAIPGGGGTDFRPVFDKLKESSDQPAALIYFTDTYGTFPETPPGYPVFWVTKQKEAEVPFGRHLHFDMTGGS